MSARTALLTIVRGFADGPSSVSVRVRNGGVVPAGDTRVANLADLQAKAKQIRRDIITSTTQAGSGHPTSSLSAVEIAVALYFGGFLRHDPKNPRWPQRERFILSNGHAAPLLYAVLAEPGYFPKDELNTLRKLDSPL